MLALKGVAKEGQRIVLSNPRLLDEAFVFVNTPVAIVQQLSTVKRGAEYEIKIY